MTRAAAVALGGLALTLAALTFDATPLFVPGVAFALIGVVARAWIWVTARGARVERRLNASRVIEGEPLEASVTVTRGACGLPGAQLLDPLVGDPVSLGGALSVIGGSRTATLRLVVRFARRGRRPVPAPSLLLRDGLDLARTVRRGSSHALEVLVLPRTEPVRWSAPAQGRQLDPSEARASIEPLAAAEVDGLRPYRDGTPASRIHWAAFARGAGLLERRLRGDADTLPLVVLDARCSGPIEDLDAAVRAAASLVLALARGGGCSLLLPGQRRPVRIESDLLSWPAAHAQLAVVEGGAQARPPVLAPGTCRGNVFYVAAVPMRRLPAALFGAGHGVGALVLPKSLCARAPRSGSFEVAGCRGFLLAARRSPSARRASVRSVA